MSLPCGNEYFSTARISRKNHTHTNTHTHTHTQNVIKTARIVRLIRPIKPVCELKSRKPVIFSIIRWESQSEWDSWQSRCHRLMVWKLLGELLVWAHVSCWWNWYLIFMSELKGSILKHYFQLPHFSAFCSNWTWACWAGPLRSGAGLTSLVHSPIINKHTSQKQRTRVLC